MKSYQSLSPELRSLVKRTVALLGQVIRQELGEEDYQRIEQIRLRMTLLRGSSDSAKYAVLRDVLAELRDLSDEQRQGVAHAFALMLELMNACESAYRTFRLRSHPSEKLTQRPKAMIYVLTAHPTEARSPQMIAVFHEIQRTLTDWLGNPGSEELQARIWELLLVAWRLALARGRKPSVRDEADSIYSMVLRAETLQALLGASQELGPVYVRTWVGGDKDGHPGVDEKRMTESLQASRTELLRSVESELAVIEDFVRRLKNTELERQFGVLRPLVKRLRKVQKGDGGRVARLRAELKTLNDIHPAIAGLRFLLKSFPGLVVPLELRESSDLLSEAARGKSMAITRMLARIASISQGGDPKWYARGLIISMASTMTHIRAAARVVRRELGALRIPVIPLFEQNAALEGAPSVVKAMLGDPMIRGALNRYWSGYFEVMVGYSDSAKETGVLKSRLEIAKTLHVLDAIFSRYRKASKKPFYPVFFHGSGGSTDRGGGSIEEQTAWWPESALRIYKATLQGETIERSFASPEITRRRLEQIARRLEKAHLQKSYRPDAVLEAFADRVSTVYQKQISNPEFLELVQRATAYRYLSDLRLGSRPAKRGKVLSVSSLRAIPWVLCWTQTRVLFPTWWGVGSAWGETASSEKARLRKLYRQDPLFGSYVKVLASTLARVELSVFRLYLENSGLSREAGSLAYVEFEREYAAALEFVRWITGHRKLLWYKPWLGDSIELRAPMIHPLNLLQILTLETHSVRLIRETVTGISSGMMTTG